jgi:hypothetical protein
MCAGDDEVTGVVVRFVGRDGEREGEKRRGLPAPSDKLSRRLMVGKDAHWCGGPTALSLLGAVSSSGDFFAFAGSGIACWEGGVGGGRPGMGWDWGGSSASPGLPGLS